jgi:hypothetical protein
MMRSERDESSAAGAGAGEVLPDGPAGLPGGDWRVEELLAGIKTLREQLEQTERKRSAAESKFKRERDRHRKGPMKMSFGAYKGYRVKDLPPDYAGWMLRSLQEQNIRAGKFTHTNAVLGPELLKVLVDVGDLDEAIQDLIAEHRAGHPAFDGEAFQAWVLAGKQLRKLQCLWMGVAFMDAQMRSEPRKRTTPTRRRDEDEQTRRSPGATACGR